VAVSKQNGLFLKKANMSNLSIKATKVFEKNRLSDKKIIVNR
jgi:hypothetical protein